MKRILLFLGTNLAGTVLYNIYATTYIRNTSTSITTDLALRLIYFTFMVIVTFVEGLLVDEFLFGGGWRRRVLSGHKPKKEEDGRQLKAGISVGGFHMVSEGNPMVKSLRFLKRWKSLDAFLIGHQKEKH